VSGGDVREVFVVMCGVGEQGGGGRRMNMKSNSSISSNRRGGRHSLRIVSAIDTAQHGGDRFSMEKTPGT
jgi:hypothetical protein